MLKKEHTHLNVRIPKTLREVIEKYVRYDLHTNLSEFTRDALREKIKRDAPELAKEAFQEARNHESS